MSPIVRWIPNVLSSTRLALVPVLWVLALRGDVVETGLGLIAAGLTDVLDGYVARRFDVATPAGAALDSLADNLLTLSGVVWLFLLRPDVVAAFAWPLAIWLVLYLSFLGLGMVKFRRFANLHLYSSKAAAFTTYAFIVSSFVFSAVPYVVGWVAFGMAVVSLVEGLACQIICSELDEHTGSIFRVRRRARRPAADAGPRERPRAGLSA
jgi:phosphatidylglycerophosphate synthase